MSNVPIMADESVFDVREAFDAAGARMADVFSLKIAKSGGLRRCLEIAAIARATGIEVYGGCMFESSIGHMAGAQMMAAVPELRLTIVRGRRERRRTSAEDHEK